MKKISIIGANSYIARNMAHVIMMNTNRYELKLYGTQEHHADGLNGYTQVDARDREQVKKIDFNSDIIFIFAGKTGSANGFDDYSTFIDVNEKILLNILNEYRECNSRARIVFPSTRLVYKGRTGLLDEDSEKEFKTIYAMNKYSCEKYLEMYHNVYGVEYTIFRICVPYGTLVEGASSYGTAEFMLKRAMNGQNITLYGDGSVRRSLVHIEDLCDIMLSGAETKGCANNVYNIGGEDYSLNEMAKRIAKKYMVDVEYIDWPALAYKIESGDTVFNDSKLNKVLNLKMRHKFEEWIGRQ